MSLASTLVTPGDYMQLREDLDISHSEIVGHLLCKDAKIHTHLLVDGSVRTFDPLWVPYSRHVVVNRANREEHLDVREDVVEFNCVVVVTLSKDDDLEVRGTEF
jgi:hypothetical protein